MGDREKECGCYCNDPGMTASWDADPGQAESHSILERLHSLYDVLGAAEEVMGDIVGVQNKQGGDIRKDPASIMEDVGNVISDLHCRAREIVAQVQLLRRILE